LQTFRKRDKRITPMDIFSSDKTVPPIPDSIDAVLPPSSALVPKRPWLLRVGKQVQPRINGWIARSSKVGDRPLLNAAQFPWVAELESHWEEIRAEAAAALEDLEKVPPLATISPDHRRIAPAGRWRSYFLVGYGYRMDANCNACPRTTQLVSKIPGLNTAFFSVLVPGTHIPAHTGVTKAFLTCHLGIQVPREDSKCRMRVAEDWVEWQEGRALIFDDVFQHEVHNDTDETRIILLIQFRRPTGILGRVVGRLFLEVVRRSRFVQDARRGIAAWSAERLA
jgi:beta-hydroxylase